MSDFFSNLVVEKIVCANRIVNPENKNPKALKGKRQHGGIAIKTAGKTEYICGGKTTVCDAENVVILPKDVEHQWKVYGGECLMIDFDYKDCGGEIFSVKVKDLSRLLLLFGKIENNRIEDTSYSGIKNFRYLYEMLSILAEHAAKKYTPSKKIAALKPAVDYIINNYHNSGISLESLSEVAGLGKANFRKIFTEVYGCPPMAYVHRIRMNKASDMLKGDYISVEMIAQQVGYNSLYHFSKMFKKHFGISPSEYRKRFK